MLWAPIITYQFRKTTEKPGEERLFCKHLFKYRSPRVNQDTMLVLIYLLLRKIVVAIISDLKR
jgi:hypothetical protein